MRMTMLAAGVLGGTLVASSALAANAVELPPGPNRDLVYGQCQTCHDLQYLKESAGIPRASWSDLLDSMKQYGLELPADQRGKILDYLATYLGPNPPPANGAAEAAAAAPADGKTVFQEQCTACHQPDAKGIAGQFPPLAGNADLFLDHTFPALVVLNGMQGPIVVGGHAFNGAMPPFGHLSDQEIAAVVNYVRSNFGNKDAAPADAHALSADEVTAARKMAMTPDQVHAHRADLKN